MKKLSRICQITLVFATVSLWHCGTPVLAQQATLSLSPPVVEILIAPNKQVTQTFNLSYQGPDLLLIPTLHLVTPQGNSGHVNIMSEPLDPATIPLVINSSSPLGEPIELKKDGGLPLTLTFEAPTTDIALDVYLALVLRTVSAQDLVTSSSTSPAISSLILVSINPTGVVPIELDIENYDLPVVHDSWFALQIEPELANQTPVMIRPEGKFEVVSPGGDVIYETELYPSLILGNATREILALMGQTSTPLSWQPSWTHIGPHRIRLTILSQGGSTLSESEKTVWILPLRASAIAVIFISMAVLNIYFLSKKRIVRIDP